MKLFDSINGIFKVGNINNMLVITILIISLLLGLYECCSYVLISKKSFNNKSILISVALIPSFISTIIFCLQQNTVITLGTIGALAIIRFRNAVKEPVDMVYLLWSVHSGIMIGCQLYLIAIFTSVLVTIVLIGFEIIKEFSRQYTLILKTKEPVSNECFDDIFMDVVKSYKIEARSFSNNSNDYILYIRTKDILRLENRLANNKTIYAYSLLDYQSGE